MRLQKFDLAFFFKMSQLALASSGLERIKSEYLLRVLSTRTYYTYLLHVLTIRTYYTYSLYVVVYYGTDQRCVVLLKRKQVCFSLLQICLLYLLLLLLLLHVLHFLSLTIITTIANTSPFLCLLNLLAVLCYA